MKLLSLLIKRLTCKHVYVNSKENTYLFGKDHVTKICAYCGKRVF